MKKLATYSDYKNEFEKLKRQLSAQEDECAKKSLSYDEMIEQTKEIRYKLSEYSQEMRLLQEPEMVFDKQWKGDYYTLEEFIQICKNEEITDADGYGYYATENGKSNIIIYPSDVLDNKIRHDFSHIVWFNRIEE